MAKARTSPKLTRAPASYAPANADQENAQALLNQLSDMATTATNVYRGLSSRITKLAELLTSEQQAHAQTHERAQGLIDQAAKEGADEVERVTAEYAEKVARLEASNKGLTDRYNDLKLTLAKVQATLNVDSKGRDI